MESTTTIKQLDAAAFYEEAEIDFGIAIRNALRDQANRQSVAVVFFQNQQMDSSHFGESVVLCVGPSNTHKSVEEVESAWLNDAPSQRMHPRFWCSREDILRGHGEERE